jgi:hypothetical protein
MESRGNPTHLTPFYNKTNNLIKRIILFSSISTIKYKYYYSYSVYLAIEGGGGGTTNTQYCASCTSWWHGA